MLCGQAEIAAGTIFCSSWTSNVRLDWEEPS